MVSSTLIEEISRELEDIPPELQREVLDFTLFVKQQRASEHPRHEPEPASRDWRQFVGALKDSPAFQGDPVTIQREMRDEWD